MPSAFRIRWWQVLIHEMPLNKISSELVGSRPQFGNQMKRANGQIRKRKSIYWNRSNPVLYGPTCSYRSIGREVLAVIVDLVNDSFISNYVYINFQHSRAERAWPRRTTLAHRTGVPRS